MTDSPLNIAELARRQLSDYDAGSPGTIFGEGLVLDEAAAYRVASHVAELRTARGERIIGYKVGCTSAVIQRQLGIDHFVFGRLFDTERHADGTKLSAARYDHLAIEGELAVRLAVDLEPGDGLDELLLGDFGAIFPVIELHNYIIRGPLATAGELIANNALHAGFVAPAAVTHHVSAIQGDMTILVGGQIADQCDSRQLQDTVTSSLRWLANTLPNHDNRLKAGDVVLTGSVCRLIPVDPPCHVRVHSPADRVEVEIVR
ncbi:MAG: hypothetical protein IIA67_10215 [Planctomycetes bacterium]|nr:hypothetical protein [Planctomycetota bacterium]